MRQVFRAGALGRPRGMGWGGMWEGGSGWGIHVNPWLIHVNVWQKPLQYCKVVSLQQIKINEKKKSRDRAKSLRFNRLSTQFWGLLELGSTGWADDWWSMRWLKTVRVKQCTLRRGLVPSIDLKYTVLWAAVWITEKGTGNLQQVTHSRTSPVFFPHVCHLWKVTLREKLRVYRGNREICFKPRYSGICVLCLSCTFPNSQHIQLLNT